MLGKLCEQNKNDIRYLVSASLCRMEAQTHLFDYMYKYVHILNLLEKDPSLTIENAPPLIEEALDRGANFTYKLRLSKVVYLFKIFAHSLYILCFAWLYRFFVGKWKAQSRYLFLCYYDYRCKKPDGNYVDSYFAPLQAQMKDMGEKYDVISFIVGKKSFSNMWQHIKDFKVMRKELNIVPVEALVTFQDVYGTFAHCLKHWFRFKGPLIYKNRDVSKVLDLAIREDFCLRNNWYFSYMIKELSPLIFHAHYRRIYYPYENHPWERVLNHVKNDLSSKTHTYAYQHTSFSLKLLNHFPTKDQKQSLPDKILTVGTVLRDFLLEYGSFSKTSVHSACALRHGYLHDTKEAKTLDGVKKIAFAFSSDGFTYPKILKSLVQFFTNTEWKVYLKAHPLFKGSDIIPKDLPANFINAESVPWNELFQSIDALLYHDNSLGIESFAYGIPSFEYGITGDVYDCFRLFRYQGEALTIRNAEDFEKFLLKVNLIKTDPLAQKAEHEKMSAYLNEYFIKPTSETMKVFLS